MVELEDIVLSGLQYRFLLEEQKLRYRFVKNGSQDPEPLKYLMMF